MRASQPDIRPEAAEVESTSAPLIDLAGVAKTFWKNAEPMEALGQVTMSVGAGEFVAVVGPSGCGKSTLLNMVAGLMRPSRGSVRYRSSDVTSVNTRVGYITQKDNLLPWRTVSDNIALALELRRMPKRRRRELTARFVELVGLTGFERHYPHELSGGMRKRVALARTLVYEPETLLMDEPFGALDAQLKTVLQDEILRLCQDGSKTVVFVTHDLDEAITLADRVAVISARPGRLRLVQEVDIPRPRTAEKARMHPRFAELRNLLWRSLKDDVLKGDAI